MTVQTLKLQGRSYVLVPEKDFRALERNARKQLAPKTSRRAPASGSDARPRPRLTAQDRGDIAEARRRLSDASDRDVPYEEARTRLGLT